MHVFFTLLCYLLFYLKALSYSDLYSCDPFLYKAAQSNLRTGRIAGAYDSRIIMATLPLSCREPSQNVTKVRFFHSKLISR